ncbi:MAG: DinB family protein [Terriglobales bacterium]|jgi:hypothetical protein
MTELKFIAEQLHKAFEGDPWHGPAVRDVLDGVSAEQAAAKPIPDAHSIWELALHIAAWVEHSRHAIDGRPLPLQLDTPEDWPRISGTDGEAWKQTQANVFNSAKQMVRAIEKFPPERITDTVPGRSYDFRQLFHGIVDHCIYHAGQIAVLKKIKVK